MSKSDIDKYISKNYSDLIKYAKSMIYMKNLQEEPEFIVTEVYLHLIKNKEQLTEDNIKDYASTFIYKNANWVNSQVRELGSKLKNPPAVEFIEDLYDIIDYGFDDAVDDEISLSDHETVIELYRQSLTSPYKIRVAKAFFDDKNYTVRKFANHFGFSTTPAMKIIQELKADINEFKNNLQKTKE